MPKLNLNAAVMAALPKPDRGQEIVWDAKLRGFGVRLTRSAATYICESRVKGRTRRVTLAPVGTRAYRCCADFGRWQRTHTRMTCRCQRTARIRIMITLQTISPGADTSCDLTDISCANKCPNPSCPTELYFLFLLL